MDNNKFENLNKFFDKIKSIGIVERIFSWKSISSLSYDAFQEFKFLSSEVYTLRDNNKLEYLKDDLNKINNKELQQKESELGRLEESNSKNEKKINELYKDISSYKGTIEQNNKTLQSKENDIGRLQLNL